MKRFTPALIAALFGPLALAASAQEFAAVPGLADSLAAVKDAAKRQKLTAQRPTLHGVMGASRFEALSALSLDEAPDVTAYPVRGVDISHYEGDIAWELVKLDGLSFMYIKATEGVDYVDAKFAQNWDGATSAGLLRGAYHFYNFCKGGAEQADHFIAVVPPDAGALPMTLDLEQSGDCKTMPDKAAFRADLAAFVEKIQSAYGHRPVIYLNYSIYNRYFSGENDPYRLWIADPSHAAPALPDGSSWAMWQYGWHGQVDGITGEVDLDVFNGTPQMLAALAGPSDVLLAALR